MNHQKNQRRQTILLATIATLFIFGASGSAFAQAGIGAKYGSRDPITCADTKAPAKGAITVALATQYARCVAEGADRDNIWLLEDLKIQVGAATPYNPKDHYPADINVKAPVYPLRGSYKRYACAPITDEKGWENRGANCTVFYNTKATGVCFKTNFGDWYCGIGGNFGGDTNLTEYKMRPPGFKPDAAPAKDKPTTDAKNNNQPNAPKVVVDENKDENGYPKPDFSEMEKYFEIRKLEYNIAAGKLYFIAKMTKENNAIDWSISFYDADDIKLGGSQYADIDSGEYYKVGDLAKYYFYLPTESIMKRVTKVVVTRNIH